MAMIRRVEWLGKKERTSMRNLKLQYSHEVNINVEVEQIPRSRVQGKHHSE